MFSNLCIVFALIAAILNVATAYENRLGECVNYAIHGGSKVAFNGGESTVSTGNVGMSPGTDVSGNYKVLHGKTDVNNTPANQCADARTTAYITAKASPCVNVLNTPELGGRTLTAGTYCDGGAPMTLAAGQLTLSGTDTDVWIFQASSSLTTSLNTEIILTGGAKAENVYWAVSSSATIGTTSKFVGTLMTYASISFETGATMNGQALAGAAVTFASDNTVVNSRVTV